MMFMTRTVWSVIECTMFVTNCMMLVTNCIMFWIHATRYDVQPSRILSSWLL
jgi:hypothetical protein